MSKFSFSYLSITFCITLVASSCKTHKVATGTVTVSHKDTTIAQIDASPYIQNHNQTHLDYRTFGSRVKISYSDGNQSLDFTAVVRMQKDSAVWVSLQGPFGIEGGRILITRDSVKVINKLSSEYLCQPISYLTRILPIEADLGLFQQFLMGYYLPFKGAETYYMGMEDSLDVVQSGSARIRSRSWLSPQNYTLAKSLLTDLMLGQQMSLTFGGYTSEPGRPFSADRNIEIKQANRTISLQLTYTKIRIDESMAFPFEVGPGMKQVDTIRF
jgi:hypothetical protein